MSTRSRALWLRAAGQRGGGEAGVVCRLASGHTRTFWWTCIRPSPQRQHRGQAVKLEGRYYLVHCLISQSMDRNICFKPESKVSRLSSATTLGLSFLICKIMEWDRTTLPLYCKHPIKHIHWKLHLLLIFRIGYLLCTTLPQALSNPSLGWLHFLIGLFLLFNPPFSMLCQLFFGMTIQILSLEHLNLRGSRLAAASVMLYHLASAGPASLPSFLHCPLSAFHSQMSNVLPGGHTLSGPRAVLLNVWSGDWYSPANCYWPTVK